MGAQVTSRNLVWGRRVEPWEGATEELSACDVQHIAVKSGPECDVRCALASIKAYPGLRLQTF